MEFWRGKKVLITGITGFVASHLAEKLLSWGAKVHGTIRHRSSFSNILQTRDRLNLVEIDLGDAHSVYETVKGIEPSVIFHLAAQSFVPMSWKAPEETLRTNIMGTLNVLEGARRLEGDVRVHFAGSSEEYGLVHREECPVNEDQPLRPLSPYGVSKVAGDLLCFQYNKSYGMKTYRTRAFNHTGPRRGEEFVTSNFAKQIAEIVRGKREAAVKVGNLEAVRDFTDVRDVVSAYLLCIEKCEPGEVYNIGTGRGRKISEVLDLLISLSGKKIKVEPDNSRLRPSDVEMLVCDSTKFRKKTGWKPTIPFEQTMKDLLDWHLGRV